MTDHNTTDHPQLHNNSPEQPPIVAILDTNDAPDSRLGKIMVAVALCEDATITPPTPEPISDFHYSPELHPSPAFCLVMDQIRLHLESKLRNAGWLGPLDFTYNDFAHLFKDVVGPACIPLFKALGAWYRTVYVRQTYTEKFWRDLFDAETPLTREEELVFFEAMRSGSADAPRWRYVFTHRNEKLVGHIVKRYVDRFPINLGEQPYWKDEHGNRHSGTQSLFFAERDAARKVLFQAGMKGLNLAIDKFKPELGKRFSTHAWKWITGEITALFKGVSFESPKLFVKPRPAEDHLDLRVALGQALDRLNDPRQSQIAIMRFGLFGSKEHKLREISDVVGLTYQRVSVIEHKTLEQLKRDPELFSFWKKWKNPRRWDYECNERYLRSIGTEIK